MASTKLTKSQVESKKLLTNTINRLAKQSGQTKAEARKSLASKLGIDNVSNLNEMAKNIRATQKRKLNEGINYQGGDILTARERKNNIQELNKQLRKARNKQGYAETEAIAKMVKAYSENKSKMKFNELNKEVEFVKKGDYDTDLDDDLNYPNSLPDAVKDKRWGTYEEDFDRHILYNLLNGDRLPLLSGNPYNYDDSSDRSYIFNL